jgi:Rrf2 family transcriptional regulator, iron-sulfur cluster assembly transcription factor
MISKRASLGLKVIAHIASTPSHRTTTADALAYATGVSLSYIEGILKDARELGLVQATRGPGGGYKLVASLNDLSVWDVVNGFGYPNTTCNKAQSSPEWRSTNLLSEAAYQFEKEFLQDYLLMDLLTEWPDSAVSKPSKSMAMNFKPLPSALIPIAPNSVFNLSNFLNLQAA